MPRQTDNALADQRKPGGSLRRRSEPRRLIAGLRVSPVDEQLLALVAPFFPEADSAGDLAYRLWRRGLELSLAELASVGTTLPTDLAEGQLATLVAQRLAGCMPLLRRTGKLALLCLETSTVPAPLPVGQPPTSNADIDASAGTTIAGLGGADFL